ncbi:hypothetical protein H8959_014846 [Pygathrix nigripes]
MNSSSQQPPSQQPVKLMEPRSARNRRALGPRRAALCRYKRPRSGPTRNPRLPVFAGVPTRGQP